MTADYHDSDARIQDDAPLRPSQSRAVDAYRHIADSNASVDEKITVANLLLPLDAKAAVEVLSKVADSALKSYQSSPSVPGQRDTTVLNSIFAVIDNLAAVDPPAAIEILFKLAVSAIPISYRIAAAQRIADVETKTSGSRR